MLDFFRNFLSEGFFLDWRKDNGDVGKNNLYFKMVFINNLYIKGNDIKSFSVNINFVNLYLLSER